jgi:hypothetical protein
MATKRKSAKRGSKRKAATRKSASRRPSARKSATRKPATRKSSSAKSAVGKTATKAKARARAVAKTVKQKTLQGIEVVKDTGERAWDVLKSTTSTVVEGVKERIGGEPPESA